MPCRTIWKRLADAQREGAFLTGGAAKRAMRSERRSRRGTSPRADQCGGRERGVFGGEAATDSAEGSGVREDGAL